MLTSFQALLDELCFWSARDRTQGVGGVTWRSARHLAGLLNAYGHLVQRQYNTLLPKSGAFRHLQRPPNTILTGFGSIS